MKKRIIIPLTIIVIILTLAILSITIKSVNWDVDEISEVTSTTELARLISLHPEVFDNASIADIFALNTRLRHNGTYGLEGNEKDDEARYIDIAYHTAACLFHDKTDANGDGYAHKITNIIEINSPGTMVVHKYTGQRGNSAYESATVDLTTDESARTIFDRMKSQGIIDSDVTYNYDNMKKDICAFAYLAYDTTVKAGNANPVASNDYKYTNTKNALHWFWKQPGGTIAIRKYAKISGKLDEYYYEAQKQNSEVNSAAEEKRSEALNAVASAIEPASIEILDASSNTLTVKYIGNKAYIGPLKVKYAGGIPTIKIKTTETENETAEDYVIATGWVTYDEGKKEFSSIETDPVTSEQEFYAVTEKSNVENLSKIKVKVELQYTTYKAKIALTTVKTNEGQNLMFFFGEQETEVQPVQWEEVVTKNIQIQKQDENGNSLTQAGIEFKVYNESNELIGTLTTQENGKTNSIGLRPNTVYVIKETVNNVYGYKNASIKDAVITGGTITEKAEEQIKVKITENAVLTIKNAPELGNLTVEKVDENGKPLSGVEFVIWQTNKGYLGIQGQATHTTTSEGTDMKDMYESKKVVYASEQDFKQATRYVTNEEGKIVLKNLEIYSAKGQKYEYMVREVSNGNYGYKGMVMTDEDIVLTEAENSDIKGTLVKDMYADDTIVDGGKDATRKKVQFILGRDTTVTVSNTQKLGNLVLHKKDKEINLENVEFILYKAVADGKGFIRLSQDSKFIAVMNKEIDIRDYDVEYVDTVDKATIFKTNEEGKISINNLEIYSGIDANYNPVKYQYYIYEKSNNEYGYKHMTMTTGDATIEGGTITEINTEMRKIEFTLSEETTTVVVEINNTLKVASLEIEKVNNYNEPVENVEFVIAREKVNYIVLKNADGEVVKQVKGTATINVDKNFEASEYSIEYVETKEAATRFITDKDGKIVINNLEVYASKTEKYNYTAYEVANDNYGYGSRENLNLAGTITELKLDETNIIKIENTKHLGKFSIIKHDENDQRIVLANVGFVIEQTSEINSDILGQYAYLALYDEEGKFQPSVTGNATINKDNIAQIVDGTKQYEVRYYYSELPYAELSDEQKAQITIFITDNYGNMSIENLEVYSPLLRDIDQEDINASKYTYRLVETSNENYGYEVEDLVQLEFKLDSGNETTKYIKNKQTNIKISGYVWEERALTKSNKYDLLYVKDTSDVKLTDLYIKNENGELQQNLNARIPVKILLRDKITNETREPDEYIYQSEGDEAVQDAGKYTFNDVEIERLSNYEIVFEYSGFYYTTIIPNLAQDNGSKVKEIETERKTLNEKFGTVKYDREIVSTDGSVVNTLEYEKNGNQSSVSKFNFDVNVHANTSETNINLKEEYDKIVKNIIDNINNAEKNDEEIEIQLPEVIDNINMGLMVREQPSILLGSDIDSVLVGVNGTEYIYKFGSRQYEMQYPDDPEKADEVAVKFEEQLSSKIEEEETVDRYMQKVYASDFNGIANNTTEMKVSVIYKIQITKLTSKLTTVVHEIENFYDSGYTIQEIGFSIDNTTKQIGNKIYDIKDETASQVQIAKNSGVNVDYSDDIDEETKRNYCSSIIPLGENGLTLADSKTQVMYIKFEVSQEAINDLQSGKSTYHNASEIVSYSTYYNESTGKGEVKNQEGKVNVVTEQGKPGEIYAGITKGAEAGNIKLNMIKDPRDKEGEKTTPVLDIEYLEIDETSAPALILVKEGTRTISGIVWEDLQTEQSKDANERLGDGQYDENTEKPIQNVTVELRELNKANGAIGAVAKYSDGETEAIVETDAEGKYTLGDPDKELGILPGTYVILYTYGQEKSGGTSFIVNKDGTTEEIDALDYKSTILKSNTMYDVYTETDNAKIEDRQVKDEAYKWFATEEMDARYSNARDNVTLREEYRKMVEYGENRITDEIYQHLRGCVVNYGTLQGIKLDKMEAYTPGIEVGIHFTADNQVQASNRDENGNITYAEPKKELTNVDFGIIERPRVIMEIDLEITQLEVVAQNGASLIPMGNPADLSTRMQSVMQLDGEVVSIVDKELLQGSTMNLEYTVEVANNSETDYFELEYYYYGQITEGMKAAARPKQVISYLPKTLTFDEIKNTGDIWKKTDLKTLKENIMVTDDVAEELKDGYNIFVTNAFEDLGQGEKGEEKMYVSKELAMSDDTKEKNSVEIIELTGIRPIQDATPGNYVPATAPNESDEDIYVASVLTPTGTTVDYTLYIIATVATLTIAGIGIFIIKKKVIK